MSSLPLHHVRDLGWLARSAPTGGMRAALAGLVLVGCAAAPLPARPTESRVVLRERPAQGERYVSSFELRFVLQGRLLRARRRMTSTVVAVDPDGALFDLHVDDGSFEELEPRLVLPPGVDPLQGATLRERRDGRGRRAGDLQVVDGTEAQTAEVAAHPIYQTLGGAPLPDGAIHEGFEWRTSGRWAFRSAGGEGRREVVYRVTSIEGTRVRVAIQGESVSAGVRVRVEGELELDAENALIASGHLDGTTGVEGGDYRIEWRTAREGEPLPPWEDQDPARPRSRVFPGEACDARVAELSARYDAAPVGRPLATDVAVPTAARGAEVPWGGTVVVTDGGFEAAGQALDLDGAAEHLEVLQRNAQVLEPGREGPLPVVVVAAADAPAAGLLALIRRVPPEARAFFLTVRVAEPPAAPPIFPPDTPAAVEALARPLPTDELASLAVGTCTPVIAAFAQAANLAPAERWLQQRIAIPNAVRACRCGGVDVDLLDATLQRIADGDRDPALRVLPMPTDLAGLRLGRRASVADLARALTPEP